MLRKDVKLGFAIGGIMLAVVIVYVLVVPGGDKKVGVVTDESQGKTDVAPSPNPSDGKTTDPEQATAANAPPSDPSKAVSDQPPAVGQSGNQPGGPSAAASGNPSATPPAAGATPSGGAADWNKLLAEGSSSPTMMSETPTLPGKSPTTPPDVTPETSASAGPSQPPVPDSPPMSNPSSLSDKTAPDSAVDTAASPATQPTASAEQRTHVVQSGEMLTSIASAAYGDSRKWKRIAEANPNVNPNRLVVGTKLIIPSLPKSSESNSAGSRSAADADSQTQYVVQPNDSLYRIAMKLYGKPIYADKLYEANKDVIGSDPKRLKLNMVLKLPEPPTNAVAAR